MLLMLLGAQPGKAPLEGLSPDRFSVHEIHGVEAPTGILCHEGAWYLTAGLPESRPGLFRLLRETNGRFVAKLAFPAMQLDLSALFQAPGQGNIGLISARTFSSEESDWLGTYSVLNLETMTPHHQWTLQINPQCYNGTYECGLSSVVHLDDNRILAFRTADPARVTLLTKLNGQWQPLQQVTLVIDRKYVKVAEARRFGDRILLLLQRRWMLVEFDIAAFNDAELARLELTKRFDFSALKKKIVSADLRTRYEGLAEGFEIDDRGNLLVVLNNNGFPYQRIPETDKTATGGRLLVFPRAIAPKGLQQIEK